VLQELGMLQQLKNSTIKPLPGGKGQRKKNRKQNRSQSGARGANPPLKNNTPPPLTKSDHLAFKNMIKKS